jgi:hypothetical protein
MAAARGTRHTYVLPKTRSPHARPLPLPASRRRALLAPPRISHVSCVHIACATHTPTSSVPRSATAGPISSLKSQQIRPAWRRSRHGETPVQAVWRRSPCPSSAAAAVRVLGLCLTSYRPRSHSNSIQFDTIQYHAVQDNPFAGQIQAKMPKLSHSIT